MAVADFGDPTGETVEIAPEKWKTKELMAEMFGQQMDKTFYDQMMGQSPPSATQAAMEHQYEMEQVEHLMQQQAQHQQQQMAMWQQQRDQEVQNRNLMKTLMETNTLGPIMKALGGL